MKQILCHSCGHSVSRARFLGKSFYMTADQRLTLIIGDRARPVGCLNCLLLLEESLGRRVEKTELEDRVVYSVRPSLFDRVLMRFKSLLHPQTPFQESNSHEKV